MKTPQRPYTSKHQGNGSVGDVQRDGALQYVTVTATGNVLRSTFQSFLCPAFSNLISVGRIKRIYLIL